MPGWPEPKLFCFHKLVVALAGLKANDLTRFDWLLTGARVWSVFEVVHRACTADLGGIRRPYHMALDHTRSTWPSIIRVAHGPRSYA